MRLSPVGEYRWVAPVRKSAQTGKAQPIELTMLLAKSGSLPGLKQS